MNGWKADLVDEVEEDGDGFLSLALHEAPCSSGNDSEENIEELSAFAELLDAEETCCDALVHLVVLLCCRREIDEESAAHVRLQTLHRLLARWLESVHEEGAVF